AGKEARASWLIGRHLATSAAPTPHMYAFDETSLALLCEDLGDMRLFTLARALNQDDPADREKLLALYRQTVGALLAMQLQAAAGFNPDWCCDTPVYDRNLMLKRESGYFLRAFWCDLLGQKEPAALAAEFRQLAAIAAQAPAVFFLHRDFQSRNIMFHEDRPRFIDYQGGRLGPLAYDLASLLIDPYVGLDQAMRRELLRFYLAELRPRLPVDEEEFRRHFLALATQRNLQILGAFAFLSQRRGKTFFAAYLQPALTGLNHLLADGMFSFLPILKSCAQRAVDLLNKGGCQ
ncbi:MAG TPA: aminoglycoside phosphotransferase, partial [Desulfobulbaceae bacterium]|nr:aminoglycoside phosphotransferase [Desulfobulbaceae bacterium]